MKHSAFHPEKMYTYLRGYASALGMKDTLKALAFSAGVPSMPLTACTA